MQIEEKSILEIRTTSRGEGCTHIGPYEMLSWQQLGLSEWEQLDLTACLLPEETLLFQEKGSGCRMFN